MMKNIIYFIFTLSIFSFYVQGETNPIKDQAPSDFLNLEVSSVNKNNIAVGVYNKPRVLGLPYDKLNTYFFYWSEETGYVTLPERGGYSHRPMINDKDEIVGLFTVKKSVLGFLGMSYSPSLRIYDLNGTYQEIPFPEQWTDRQIRVVCFNNDGQLLISGEKSDEYYGDYALWENGDYRYFDELNFIEIVALNNRGVLLAKQKVLGNDLFDLVLYDLNDDKIFYRIPVQSAFWDLQLNDDNQVTYTNNEGTFLFDPD